MFGETAAVESVAAVIRRLLQERSWRESDARDIRARRTELERGASAQNIKRAPGGTLDVEYIVQIMQLRHAHEVPEVLMTNTQAAIAALEEAKLLSGEAAKRLSEANRFLRRVESGLRLLGTSARHDLPEDLQELRRLALLLGHSNAERLREQCLHYMAETRAEFDRLVREL